jgi:anti-anti-sigma factor
MGQVSVLRLLQDLDFNASRGFRSMLEEQMEDGVQGIVLDMTSIAYVASITIGILVEMHNRIRGGGGVGLVLLHPQEKVKDILRLVHLGRVIPIIEDEDEAKKRAGGVS